MKMRRVLSALLTAAMLFSAAATLPFTGSAAEGDPIVISKTNPVITADVGEEIDLSRYDVTADNGTVLKAKDLSWTLDGKAVETVKAGKKGVLTLTASAGSVTERVYLVAKEPEETEYVLYENDFDCTAEDLKAEGWNFLNAGSVTVSDGVFHMGSKSGDYYRAILPEWLGDFGDYAISIMASQTDVLNGSRWCSIAYRIENANRYYYPYYHMCVRANTTSSTVEFAERTPANGWNVIYKTSETLDMTDAGYHNLTVIAYENTVQYLIDGESQLFIGDAKAHPKGYVGLISNYGTMNVDSIRITVQEAAPERPKVVPKLIDNSANRGDSTITNYVSNHAYVGFPRLEEILQNEELPAAVYISLKSMGGSVMDDPWVFEQALTMCAEKNVIPQFKLTSKEQVDKLNDALKVTKVPEVLVGSDDPEVVKYARGKNKTVIRGALDLSEWNGPFSDQKIYDIYNKAAGAYAQAVILSEKAATKDVVAKLQEFELAVWVFDEMVLTVTQGARMIASGANAVVSNDYQLIASVQKEIFTASDALTRTPVWTAHRGYSTKYPENSMAACIGAYEVGADCIEIDVHLSADGVVMVMHDGSIDRTTNGTGNIANMTCDQLKQYRLKNASGVLTQEVIPTFEEILQEFQGKDVKFLCEIKSGQAGLSKACVDLIKKYEMEDQVVFISFYANQLTEAKKYLNVSTGYLIGATGFSDGSDHAGTLNAYYEKQTDILNYHATMAINYGNLTSEFLRDANDRGLTLWTWTYNLGSAAQVCKMFLAGVNGMTTDDPQYLKNTVKTISAPADLKVNVDKKTRFEISSLTYGGKEKAVTDKAEIIMLENDGVIRVEADGSVWGLKAGTASFMVAYQTKLPDGQTYTLYSQPIVVEVGNEFGTLTPKALSGWQLKDGLLTGVETRLNASDLADGFVEFKYGQIYDENEEFLSPEAPVRTGTLVSLYGQTATVVVKGDLNGDGKCNAVDYILLKRFTAGKELAELQTAAADMNGDGNIRSADYALLKRHAILNADAHA